MSFLFDPSEAGKIRLVASDIDGTLLPEGTSDLDPRMFTLIRRLKQQGVFFAAASGRGYESASHLFAPALDDMLFIVENGSLVMERGQVLYSRSLPRQALEELVAFVREQDKSVVTFWMLAGALKQYTEVKDEAFIQKLENGYNVHYERVDDVLSVQDPTLLKCAVYTNGDAAVFAKELEERFGSRISIAPSGAHWIDCNPAGADKGDGLSRVQEYLGISKEETIAFGDNTNDIPMLQAAGLSFAVEEGRPEVREAASHSAGKMTEGGVMRILEQLESYLTSL